MQIDLAGGRRIDFRSDRRPHIVIRFTGTGMGMELKLEVGMGMGMRRSIGWDREGGEGRV